MILYLSLSSPAFALRPLTTDDACMAEGRTFQLEVGITLYTLIFFPVQ